MEVAAMDATAFRERFRQTPMWRTKRAGAVRNAAYVLGNQKDPAAISVLARLLSTDSDPTIRGAAAWALGKIGGAHARAVLAQQQSIDLDPNVVAEIQSAMDQPVA